MKKALFILIFLAATLVSLSQNQKLYVVFGNFDRDTTNNVITDFYDQLYYQPMTELMNFGELVTSLPFTDATFKDHKITDFDVAVFPMGKYPLNWSTPGGIKVIDKIMEMVNAGKDVVIIGNAILWWALDGSSGSYGKDPKVQNLLQNILGINYLGRIPTAHQSGPNQITFDGFIAFGAQKDPVTQGYRKHCNMIYTESNVTNEAWRYYTSIDAFKLKSDSKYIPIDYLNVDKNDTILGTRTTYNNSKIVFWSISFDIACEKLHFEYALRGALLWFVQDKPMPWPFLQLQENPVLFGSVEVGSSIEKEIKVKNFGTQVLNITKASIEEWEDPPNTFEIVESDIPIQLKTLEEATVKVKFSPTENRDYKDFLAFESNAYNGESISADLQGTGGKPTEQGPKLALSDSTWDFGKLKLGKNDVKIVKLISSGTSQLIIEGIDFVQNDDNAYDFIEGSSDTPIVLETEATHDLKIRFMPTKTGQKFTAKVKITTNGKISEREKYITLTGEAEPPSSVYSSSADINGLFSASLMPIEKNGEISINIINNSSSRLDLATSLHDITGRKIKSMSSIIEETSIIDLNTSNLSSGAYFIIIEAGGKKAILPVMITE